MKLGVAYNLFDGVELLESSVDSIRQSCDYICVVYQLVSNLGHTSNVDVIGELSRLVSLGKVDHIVEYVPKQYGGHVNEVAKRNLGLELVRTAGCSHYMSADTDEMYDYNEFEYSKKAVEDGNFDSSCCKMLTYYRSGEFIVDPPEEYFVPLIYKIDDRLLSMSAKWTVSADPTRRMEPKNMKIFDRSEIQMHHFSYVRKDIRAKLTNSSAAVNFAGRIEEIASHYDNWEFGQKCMFAGREKRMYDVKRVENKFNIIDYGR